MDVKFLLSLCTEGSIFFYKFTFHLLYSLCKKNPQKNKQKTTHLGKHSLNTVYMIMKVSNAHYLIKFVKYKVKYSVN